MKLTIKITHDTIAKLRTSPANELDSSECYALKKGEEIPIAAVSPIIERNHARVTLGRDTSGNQINWSGRNTWYLYVPHTNYNVEPTRISKNGIDLIKHFEGCKLSAYRCPAGIATIGWGATTYPDGSPVEMGDIISQQQADANLQNSLRAFETAVLHLCKIPLNQSRLDALTSFAFNVGVGALEQSTLLRKLNAGDVMGASQEFGRWVNGGSGPLPGLVTRRAAERALFEGRNWRSVL